MNLGGWGVQAFITYFFISYIYYVLFIKRVYENHMIMCDGYIMLTFFISTHLINRNNCVASKLTYIYSVVRRAGSWRISSADRLVVFADSLCGKGHPTDTTR